MNDVALTKERLKELRDIVIFSRTTSEREGYELHAALEELIELRSSPRPADHAEVVAGLRKILRHVADEIPTAYRPSDEISADQLALSRAITALESRAEGRWVEWKSGDALPAEGMYWVTREWQTREGKDVRDASYAHSANADDWEYSRAPVRAYWSIPLPPPYEAPKGEGAV